MAMGKPKTQVVLTEIEKETIRQVMKDNNLNQDALASLTGVSRTSIMRVVGKPGTINYGLAHRIYYALNEDSSLSFLSRKFPYCVFEEDTNTNNTHTRKMNYGASIFFDGYSDVLKQIYLKKQTRSERELIITDLESIYNT
jgi:hypothetical protein